MADSLSILYRGRLSSCNYDCHYCPFAKHRESRDELAADRRDLQRFVKWVSQADRRISVLFTPWGEALIRRWYQDAFARLSQMPNVRKVAIQTNLSCPLGWLAACEASRIGLWCTFHPSQATRERFLRQCKVLDDYQVSYSVGVVGLKENRQEIERLRCDLPDHVYLWINAYKDQPDYYSQREAAWLAEIDPLFAVNNQRHVSRGHACRAGHTVVSVDGAGDVRRCHFIPEILGNLYDGSALRSLQSRECTNATCGCHIGYVHLHRLGLYEVFGEGVLERVPLGFAG